MQYLNHDSDENGDDSMKTLNKRLLAIAAIAAIPAVVSAQVSAQNVECQGITFNIKAVALPPGTKILNPVVDFSGSGGQLDPTPLLQTDIEVPALGRPVCVVVHFSTQSDPQDNAIVFQASMDNIPMAGHGNSLSLPTPVVYDPEETNLNNSRMLAYTFFAQARPGKHTIRIRIASCCTSNPTGGLVVRGASIVVKY